MCYDVERERKQIEEKRGLQRVTSINRMLLVSYRYTYSYFVGPKLQHFEMNQMVHILHLMDFVVNEEKFFKFCQCL